MRINTHRSARNTQHKCNNKDLKWGRPSGGVYVPCIYTHARWELPQATQVFVVVLVLRISSGNYLPCALILREHSGPRSVSDLWFMSSSWLCPSQLMKTSKWLSLLPIVMQESVWRWQRSVRYSLPLSPPTPPHPLLVFPSPPEPLWRQIGVKRVQPTNQTKPNSHISFIVISFQLQNEVKPGYYTVKFEQMIGLWSSGSLKPEVMSVADAICIDNPDFEKLLSGGWGVGGGGGGWMRAVGVHETVFVYMHACFVCM